jgi:hypothetical protein
MDALDHLTHHLRTAHPDLPLLEGLVDDERCIDIQIGSTCFLLSCLREWRAGLVVHADLGTALDAGPLMHEALRLNCGNAVRHEPIYALQDEALVCRYRLALSEARAAELVERLQRVAAQQQTWIDAGWLSRADEEACA